MSHSSKLYLALKDLGYSSGNLLIAYKKVEFSDTMIQRQRSLLFSDTSGYRYGAKRRALESVIHHGGTVSTVQGSWFGWGERFFSLHEFVEGLFLTRETLCIGVI